MIRGRNAGPLAGLLFAALIVVRYVVLRGGSHGSARAFVGLIVVFALISARVFLARRR
jgi:hypothetical protein